MVQTHSEARARFSGTLVVALVIAIVLGAAGYLIWQKHATGQRYLPFSVATNTGTMLLVPAGRFVYGLDKQAGVAPAFYIDQTEVTNRAYLAFCRATRRELPSGFPQDRPEYPVVNINIEDAAAFAKWAGKRLPDSLEWEKAARGAQGYLYSWGDTPEPQRANVADRAPEHGGATGLLPADSMPQHASPSRALHMTGNAAEWVRTTATPDAAIVQRFSKLLNPPPGPAEPWFLMRGGSYLRPLADAALWRAEAVPGRYAASDLGFRCVMDPPR